MLEKKLKDETEGKRRKIEEEWRIREEQKMKRIRENPKEYLKKFQKLTAQNESLKRKNNSLSQQVKRFESILIYQDELRQKVKYYKNKYIRVSKSRESTRKEVGQAADLEKKSSAQTEMNISRKCSFSGETGKIKGSIKEKFESMNEQYQIIRKFSIKKKKTRKVHLL